MEVETVYKKSVLSVIVKSLGSGHMSKQIKDGSVVRRMVVVGAVLQE